MKYKQWNRTHCDSEARAALERAGIPPLAALALCARGQDTPEKARAFLACGQELLHDPLLMLDMDKAAGRLRLALERDERIAVYGDYDVARIQEIYSCFNRYRRP